MTPHVPPPERFSRAWFRAVALRLVPLFVGVMLPMWAFAELAEEIHEQEVIPFDEPVLLFARSIGTPALDGPFLLISRVGYAWGVVPVDILLVLALLAIRRFREGIFAAAALGGSALLNIATKTFFSRERPALWESLAPEHTFSFPSGHAMGSATLAAVAVLLAWHTRLRWPMLVLAAAFVVAVGFSRVYLGVHYPSDILAGWAAGCVWAVAVYLVAFRHRKPWRLRPGLAARPRGPSAR